MHCSTFILDEKGAADEIGVVKTSLIAGASRWNMKNRKAYGICMSLYDQHPVNGKISGRTTYMYVSVVYTYVFMYKYIYIYLLFFVSKTYNKWHSRIIKSKMKSETNHHI